MLSLMAYTFCACLYRFMMFYVIITVPISNQEIAYFLSFLRNEQRTEKTTTNKRLFATDVSN